MLLFPTLSALNALYSYVIWLAIAYWPVKREGSGADAEDLDKAERRGEQQGRASPGAGVDTSSADEGEKSSLYSLPVKAESDDDDVAI